MNRRTNILHLISALAMGGAESIVLGLAQHASHDRFMVHIGALREPHGKSLQPDFEQLGLPLTLFRNRGLYNPVTLQAVIAYARTNQIDVIHTHLLLADIYGRIAGRILGIPVVSTLHNVPKTFAALRFDRLLLEQLTARFFATRLVAISRYVRQCFIEDWKLPVATFDVVYNAVPVERYLGISASLPASELPPMITTIGRLHRQKAQHILLEAAKIVLQQHPDATFMLIGQGELEQQLKDRAVALGIRERVIFAGVRRDIPDLLAQSTIFALSSLWEGLPLSAIEAMAAARPVVLTDVGGNRELVQHDVTGIIVPPNDVAALADALVALIRDPQRRFALGSTAREYVRHSFDSNRMVQQYESIYEEVMQERVAKPIRRSGIAN